MTGTVTVAGALLFTSIIGVTYLLLRGHHHGHHRGVVLFSTVAGLIVGASSTFGQGAADGIGAGFGAGSSAATGIARPEDLPPPPPAPSPSPATPAPPASSAVAQTAPAVAR